MACHGSRGVDGGSGPVERQSIVELVTARRLCWLGVTAVLLLVHSTCVGGFSPVFQRDTPISPNEAERALEQAFALFLIPVVERHPNGRVRSGPFDPEHVWGVLTWDRISCGADDSVDGRLRPTPKGFEIVVTIRNRRQAGTRVDLDGFGQILSDKGEKIPCRLRGDFAKSILAVLPAEFRGWGPPDPQPD
jgi:hypothetical protein